MNVTSLVRPSPRPRMRVTQAPGCLRFLLLSALSGVLVGGRAAAQVNLLPQGDFVHPEVNTGMAEGFNIPNNQEFRVVSEGGKHWLRIENRDPKRQLDYVHAYVKVDSRITSLTVSVRMRATNLKVGKEGWHDARVALMFEGGSFGYPAEIPELRADSDWVTKTVELKVPAGATRLNIQPAMFYCTGVFEIADLTVTPHVAASAQLGNAALPAGISLNWDTAAVKPLNAKRSRISLDGVWRFAPSSSGAAPALGWGYIRVPGDWQGRSDGPSAIVAPGGGPEWSLYDGARVARAWYERELMVPEEWRGRAISINFDRVSTDARVYVNGADCGRMDWPWGSVDITRAIVPGQKATIRVLVAAIADADKVGDFWQNALSAVTYSSATLQSRGLTGSVWLESRSSDARVTDVFVRTSTRRKEVTLDVELAGVRQAGPVHLVADMLDEKGSVEKTFTVDAQANASEKQTLSVTWPWPNPRLWDVGRPNLYTLRLKASGDGLDDEVDQQFGFREFWSEGRKLILNGTEIRLRQGCFAYGPRPQVGENFTETGSPTVDARGDSSDSGPDLDDADQKGYLAAQYVLNANRYVMGPGGGIAWEQNRQRALERADVWMRRYRNHPSIVMWIAGFNFFGSAVDQDPRYLGRHGWDLGNQRWQQILTAGSSMFGALKQLDPTRLYYSHAGAYTGDVYTLNCYLDVLPLQEREDWLSAWVKSGEMPVSMVEFGTPMDCTWRRGRDGFTSNITSEPLLTEFAAIYFGADAYTSEEPKYRQLLHDLFRGGMLYDSSENKLDDFADNHKMQQLYRTSTWRSWRTAGLAGGMRTWSWVQDALKENNGPTLAWIAGRSGAYTSKDHHFRSGQKFEKQVVLINDSREPQDYTATWTAWAGANRIGGGTLHGSLAVSEIRQVPIALVAPPVAAGGKIDGRIDLAATIGRTTHHDSFAFRVFGPDPAGKGMLAVVDPGGMTTKMLRALGYTTSPWHGEAAPLVVIGRNALKLDPAALSRLEGYVQRGGRALLCEQDPEWLERALGWRVCPDVSRRVFPMAGAPSLGIDAEDLRDWTGDSTLVQAYPVYQGRYRRGNEGDQPYAGWHWGNAGGVTSAAIEKPHRSGWRPLLECEFDLAYSPLMELDYGKGRLVVCTLDLEDHVAQDPAARRMAGQVLSYAAHAPLAPRAGGVVYVGGPSGAAWLDSIGVSYQRSAHLDSGASLLLVGPDASVEPGALTAYLQKGGKALFLPQSRPAGTLGVALSPAPADFAGSLAPPDWPEARGLSASDLRWRTHLDSAPWVLSGGADIGAGGLVGRKRLGKGVAIFCQIDPDRFNADEKTYFRYTRWRATRAVAQLLANLGASFTVDSQVFHPRDLASIDLDGQWKMKGTLSLPPAASDTAAHPDPGITSAARAWVDDKASGAGWGLVALPGMAPFFKDHDGEAVFQKEVVVPKNEAGKDMTLALGVLDDFDTVFFNGVEVGHTDISTASWWTKPRSYPVPGRLVRAGENIITVRLFDRYNDGGFAGNGGLPMSLSPSASAAAPAYYHRDYRTDFIMGDNPYRYYRW